MLASVKLMTDLCVSVGSSMKLTTASGLERTKNLKEGTNESSMKLYRSQSWPVSAAFWDKGHTPFPKIVSVYSCHIKKFG